MLSFLFSFLLFSTCFLPTFACGGFFCAPQQPVVQSGEAIVFGVEDGTDVTMHVLINYEGPAEDFSWLLPVMFEPTLETSSESYFVSMFQETLPQFNFQILEANSTTCEASAFSLDEEACPVFDGVAESAPSSTVDRGVEVQEGTVGPFDFKIIFSPDRDVEAVTDWLAENGYDEYVGSREIMAHYVNTDHYFITMRLRKDSDAGDIVPVAIKYSMPEPMDTIACIPLILTGVAATESMPILVYVLGNDRADPVNYFRVELDDTLVDWVGCQNNPACFDSDYRGRALTSFRSVNDHAFVVEYAGPSSIMDDKIRFSIDKDTLLSSASLLELLNQLADANVPSFRGLDNIFSDFVVLEFTAEASFFCTFATTVYNPLNRFQMEDCANSLVEQDIDLVGLATEIHTKVIEPADAAQKFTDSFTYLTRLWVDMRQEFMIKDPFFSFRENSTLPDVSNVHSATAVPVCDGIAGKSTELEITVEGGGTSRIGATFGCFGWARTDSTPLYDDNKLPISRLVVPGFGSEKDFFLLPDEDGSVDNEAVTDAFALMDSRVMSQTIEPIPTPSPATSATQSLLPWTYYLLLVSTSAMGFSLEY